jgi:hypothetical protein
MAIVTVTAPSSRLVPPHNQGLRFTQAGTALTRFPCGCGGHVDSQRQQRPGGTAEEASARHWRGRVRLDRLLDCWRPGNTGPDQLAARANSDHSSEGRAVMVTAPPQFQQVGSVAGSLPPTSHDPQYQCARTLAAMVDLSFSQTQCL